MKRFKRILLQVLFLLAILSTVKGYGQKVSFNNIKFSYIRLPLYPLPKQYETFRSTLNIDLPDESRSPNQLINQYLKLPGYIRTTNNPDLEILADFGEFKIADKNLHSDDVFNVNAGENRTGYLYEIRCEYPVNLRITTGDGTEILNQKIDLEKNLNFEFGKWHYSKQDLENKFSQEIDQVLQDKQTKCISSAMSEIRNILSGYYGYSEQSQKVKIASGKGKKYDYSDLDEAVLAVEKALSGTVNMLEEDAGMTQEFNHALELWNRKLDIEEEGSSSGITPSIRMMLWYNCSFANLWLKNFDKARLHLEQAEALKSDDIPSSHLKMLVSLSETIDDLEKRYRANISK